MSMPMPRAVGDDRAARSFSLSASASLVHELPLLLAISMSGIPAHAAGIAESTWHVTSPLKASSAENGLLLKPNDLNDMMIEQTFEDFTHTLFCFCHLLAVRRNMYSGGLSPHGSALPLGAT